jgi:hypothetical protein
VSGRLVFDPVPEEDVPAPLRRVLDRALRSIRSVLDGAQGGINVREQFGGVVQTVIDTAAFPVRVAVPARIKAAPLAVLLLRATPQRSASSLTFTGKGVSWEWRAGALLIHSVDGFALNARYDTTLLVLE